MMYTWKGGDRQWDERSEKKAAAIPIVKCKMKDALNILQIIVQIAEIVVLVKLIGILRKEKKQ